MSAAHSQVPALSSVSRPIIDPTWRRAPDDHFLPNRPYGRPDASNGQSHRLRGADAAADDDQDEQSDGSSEWSFTEETELITLDLGSDRLARKTLLGHVGGVSAPEPKAANRFSRGVKVDVGRTAPRASTEACAKQKAKTGASASASAEATAATIAEATAGSSSTATRAVPGAGRPFSITGLDTTKPLIKIGNVILRGQRAELIGSEILLRDDYDASRPLGQQHALRPFPPSETSSSSSSSFSSSASEQPQQSQQQQRDRHPTTQSSTTSMRIQLTPIYDPSNEERLPLDVRHNPLSGDLAALAQSKAAAGSSKAASKAKVAETSRAASRRRKDDSCGDGASSDEDLPLAQVVQGSRSVADSPVQTPKPRGRRPNYELTEEELLLRKAEKSVRKAVRKREKEAQQALERNDEGASTQQGTDAGGEAEADEVQRQGMQPRDEVAQGAEPEQGQQMQEAMDED
ncbi:hypothetical protein ACQY0O_001608 [Thecaphora frezii]